MKGTSMTTATTTNTRESKETVSLIASDKVEGTAVYGADQKKIGKLERVMIDKLSGKVAYAVLSFGGFMGMGEDFYPMPWSTLKYDTNLGGYRANLTKDQLDKAPKYSKSADWNWNRDNAPQTKRARLDRRNRRKAYSSSDKRRYNDRCIKRLSLLWFARKTNLPPTCTTRL